MKGLRQVMLALLAAMVLSGCTVVGKWSLASVDPEAARRDFEYTSLTLQKDGTFYAEEEENGIKTTSGTYSYGDGVLSLSAHDGERHTYDAHIRGDRLHLEEVWKGQKLKAEFERKEN